jgi:YegS/Rv2252/BmrU family lipid kinase
MKPKPLLKRIASRRSPRVNTKQLKIAIIINGISHKKKKFYRHIFPLLKEFSPEVYETKYAGHAVDLAEVFTSKHYDLILAAGGDGTISQIVNGMLRNDYEKLPVLGIIPLGSGNDFAAMLGLKPEGHVIAELIRQWKTRLIDVGKIECLDEQGNTVVRYSNNVCSVGMGPATVQRLERLPRWMGATIRYYLSVIDTFLTNPVGRLEIKTEATKWQGKARVIAIANGISFGNKIYIAPDAKPDDGTFNTFIATNMPLLKFLYVLLKVKSRIKLVDNAIHYGTASEVTITATSPAWIESEGELAGLLPAHISVERGRIRVLA